LAKFVPHDAFVFDDSVKNNSSYVADYTALPSQPDPDISVNSPGPNRKIPLIITLAVASLICGSFWAGIAVLVLKLLHH
jgi:hypothetical protein